MSRSFELSRRLFLIGAGSAVATAAAAGTPSSLILPGVAPIIRKQVTSLSLPDGVHEREISTIYMSGNAASHQDSISTLSLGRPGKQHPVLQAKLEMTHSVMWRSDPIRELVLTKQAPVVYIEWERVPRHGGVIMLGVVDHFLPPLGDWSVRQAWLHTFHFDYDGTVRADAAEQWSLDEADGGLMLDENYWVTRDRNWLGVKI